MVLAAAGRPVARSKERWLFESPSATQRRWLREKRKLKLVEKGGRQTALDNYGYEGAKAAQPQGEVRCKECNAITRMTRADLLKYLDEQQQSMLCRVCGEDVKAPAEARAAHLVRLLESLDADQGGMQVDVQELDSLVRNSAGELSSPSHLPVEVLWFVVYKHKPCLLLPLCDCH